MNHSVQPHGQEWSLLFQLTSEAQSMRETTANGELSISAPELLLSSPYGSPKMELIFTSICPLYSSEAKKQAKNHPEGCPLHTDTRLGCHYLGTSLSAQICRDNSIIRTDNSAPHNHHQKQ